MISWLGFALTNHVASYRNPSYTDLHIEVEPPAMSVADLGSKVAQFIYDYQTLITGFVALAAAFMTIRPMQQQLTVMRIQTNTAIRDFHLVKMQELRARGDAVLELCEPVLQDLFNQTAVQVFKEGKAGVDQLWAGDAEEALAGLRSALKRRSIGASDPAQIKKALISFGETLDRVIDHLHAIYAAVWIPTDTDHNISEDESEAIGHAEAQAQDCILSEVDALKKAADGLAAAFIAEVNTLGEKLAMLDKLLLNDHP